MRDTSIVFSEFGPSPFNKILHDWYVIEICRAFGIPPELLEDRYGTVVNEDPQPREEITSTPREVQST